MPKTLKRANLNKKTKKHKRGRQLDYTKPGRLAYEGKSSKKELLRITKWKKMGYKKKS